MQRFFIQKSTLIFLSLVVLAGCRKNNQNQSYQQQAPELPVETVKQGDASVSREYAAAVEGVSNVEIRPQVTGYLSKIFVDEGDYVRAGQSLFKIEDQVFREQLKIAQAALITAQANLSTSKIDLDRKKELFKNKMVSDIQVKEAEAAYNAARGAVSSSTSSIQSAKINLNFSTIKAPVSGFIGRFNYRLGSLMTPGNQLPITLLSDIHQVYTYFSMSENDFNNFQKQQVGSSVQEVINNTPAVSLLLSGGEKYTEAGKIDAVEGQFNKTTGSITLRAKFNNPNNFLRSGNTGKIVMNQFYSNVILLPIASTRTIQDKVFVFTIKNGKAVMLPVEVNGKAGDQFIVSNGLKAGDQYITTGFDRLQPGTPVVAQKKNAQQKKS
ncbi:efflux transporter periplasmic adaptor subunit [Chryseobacterium lactis]|uniref:Efflux RND transporter periplasmic adaptor subunit n=1 Tax=Chryseobacterium lactis TaxID=1241981 RepID=A0A3G6RQI7_CHRLC|nr:efflux RND transporter periplasmic adaptor subunit [Chryseobacterium lactis]AZA85268.1 efflux RND transporter periplasmic adaptor subunit [Chryseobacterium lactis]AZB07215.1 efflux RND transporter periplasmic adaptor subunit [Chryseobacterium lactis]PNW14842.1 efflux transporter periplasmic adaptor subunit [Chryseobacterium lactis]